MWVCIRIQSFIYIFPIFSYSIFSSTFFHFLCSSSFFFLLFLQWKINININANIILSHQILTLNYKIPYDEVIIYKSYVLLLLFSLHFSVSSPPASHLHIHRLLNSSHHQTKSKYTKEIIKKEWAKVLCIWIVFIDKFMYYTILYHCPFMY